MKRRSFLSLLGLAPAAPLIAREIAKAEPVIDAADVVVPPSRPERVVSYEPSDTSGLMFSKPAELVLTSEFDVRGSKWVSRQ